MADNAEPSTDVIFRVYRKGGDVLAIFPHDLANTHGYDVACYQHVGQHGAGDYHAMRLMTRPATEAEYASLKRELEAKLPYAYHLRVIKRMSRAKWQAALKARRAATLAVRL